MKKKLYLRKMSVAFLALVVAVTGIPFMQNTGDIVYAEEPEAEEPVAIEEDTELVSATSTSWKSEVKSLLKKGIDNQETSVDIRDMKLLEDNWDEIYDYLKTQFLDVPAYYYISDISIGYTYWSGDESHKIGSLKIKYKSRYIKTDGSIDKIKALSDYSLYKARINYALSGISDGMTDLEKLVVINQWMTYNCSYGTPANDADAQYTAEGVFLYGTAVCDGYSKALKVLLDELGIESQRVISFEMNHAWNVVKIDGNWYHVDMTGKLPGLQSFNSFMKSDAEMQALGYGDWSSTAPKCNISNKFDNYIFNVYDKKLYWFDDGKNSFGYYCYPCYDYYNGNWYFASGKSIYKGSIDNKVTKVKTNTSEIIGTHIIGDYIYYVDVYRVMRSKISDIASSREVVYTIGDEYSGHFIDEVEFKENKIVLHGIKSTWSELSVVNKTIYINTKSEHYVSIADSMSMEKGETKRISATTNTKNKVYWMSTDESIATVDSNGNVTAKSAGQVKIIALSYGVKDTCVVTVKKEAISLRYVSKTIYTGESFTFPIIKTSIPSNTAVSYRVGNMSIATVDANGKVTAKKAGNTYLYATTKDGLTSKCLIKVKQSVPAKTLSIRYVDKTIYTGQTFTFTATMTPTNTTSKVTWRVGNTSVATVDANGKVTAKKAGNTYLYATTSNGITVKCLLKIKQSVPAKTLSIRYVDKTIYTGQTFKFTATVTPTNTTSKVAWRVGNTSIATVDSTGKVTAKKAGNTYL